MVKKSSKILITGGAGFIGIHLTNYLLSKGFTDITILDVSKPRIKNVKFICSDFSNFKEIGKILEDIDYVFHLAAMVGVDRCRLNPEKVKRVNYTNARRFIDLCVNKKVTRFVFSSSSEVYGNSKEIPYKEDSKLEPISEYAKSKVRIERYLKEITDKTNMTVGIVRFFNVYGPFQRKDFVIPLFVDNALHERPLIIFGNGNQIRCPTYVADAITGLYKVLICNKTKYEIFNIGGSTEYTVNNLAKTVLRTVSKSKSKIIYQKYGEGIRDSKLEILRRVPDVSKAAKALGFKAKVPLSEGIKMIIKETSDEK